MKKLWNTPMLEELNLRETACWPSFPWFPQKPQKPQKPHKPCLPPFMPTWPTYPPCGNIPGTETPDDETEYLS